VPRDGTRLAELLREAVAVSDGPTALRFPRGNAVADIPAVARLGGMDVLREPAQGAAADVLLLGAGPMAGVCVKAAGRLADHGIGVTVVDPRWVKPLDEALVGAARAHRLVVTVEDNGRAGGFGDAVCRLLRDHDEQTPVKTFGLPQQFLEHGDRGALLADAGLDAQHLARLITEAVAHRTPQLAHDPQA